MLKEIVERSTTTNNLALLEVAHLDKQFGRLEVLRDVNITVANGEFVSIIGPSGSGKSTLFNILAGLDKDYSGEIKLNSFSTQNQFKNAFAYMPQRDALMAWRTVLDNVILAAELQGVDKAKARLEALKMLKKFGLEQFAKSYPFELSGGMRQRVALIRTVLAHRPILLLDEPFGALDALTRASLQAWLLELQERLQTTIIFITHDVEEAILLSDRIYVFSARPTTVKAVLEVKLPHPRSLDLALQPQFIQLKTHLLANLRDS